MDTRFWGPSGWRLLHSITFAYNPTHDKSAMREFFGLLPYVLPCKFCRASLTEYMEKHPLEPALASKATLTRWLWRVHNEVNAKLRSQNLPVAPDPPFEKVSEFYEDLRQSGCSQTEFPGWDFLFSIADLHPLSKLARKSIPMPGAPPCETIQSDHEKNRWNCLKSEDRMAYYKRFWASIGPVLPFAEWRTSWARHSAGKASALNTREGTVKALYDLRCAMEKDLDLLNRCKYSSLCKVLQSHRSGCAKSTRAKTCRKRKTT